MRGYFKYQQNQHRDKGMFINTVSYVPYYETCWQGEYITIQRLYIVAYYTLLQLGKQKKKKVMDIT